MGDVIPFVAKHPQGYLIEAFGPDGHLSKASKGYEMRAGQLELARAIDRTLTDGGQLLVEGPCGVGKSRGYLVPAIEHAVGRGQKAIVVTASIALQEQLVTRELPELRRILPRKFTFGLLKGKNNYVCNERVPDPSGLPAVERDQMADISAWLRREGCTGDRASLAFVPIERVWSRFTVDSDDCKGRDCPKRSACFHAKAREGIAEADVIVTNYHTLFADLALRAQGAPGILPDHPVLICDEAHESADIARDFLGATITPGIVRRMAKFATEELGWGVEFPPEHNENVESECNAVFAAVMQFARADMQRNATDEFLPSKWRVHLDEPKVSLSPLVVWLGDLAARARGVLEQLDAREEAHGSLNENDKKRRARARTAARKFTKLHGWVSAVNFLEDPNLACWLDLDAERDTITIEVRPALVAPILRDGLWSRFRSVVLTSATLTTAGTFDFVRRETGISPEAMTLAVESPFEFSERCVVLVPTGLPTPTDRKWSSACADVLRSVVEQADGRTLALFSSRTQRDSCFDAMPRDDGRRWLRQGDMPSRALTDAFRMDHRSVLFGTRSFWTGIDVPGESLSVVVIDRIPFPSHDEPVLRKLRQGDGRNAFERHDLPRALIQLRQGFGRLIRSKTDCGVVVLLDSRITTSRWGDAAWASLPRTKRSGCVSDVGMWLERLGNQAAAPDQAPAPAAEPMESIESAESAKSAGAQ